MAINCFAIPLTGLPTRRARRSSSSVNSGMSERLICGLGIAPEEGGQARFGSGASPRLCAEVDVAGSGSVRCQDSNSVRAMPLCLMIERSVPMASSG